MRKSCESFIIFLSPGFLVPEISSVISTTKKLFLASNDSKNMTCMDMVSHLRCMDMVSYGKVNSLLPSFLYTPILQTSRNLAEIKKINTVI